MRRSEIVHGRISYTVSIDVGHVPRGVPQQNRIECRFIFKGDRILFERTADAPATFVKSPSGESIEDPIDGGRSTERILLTADRIYRYSPDRLASGSTLTASSSPRDADLEINNALLEPVFDPRFLGVIPIPLSLYSSKTKFSLLEPTDKDLVVERDRISQGDNVDTDAWKVSFTRKRGSRVALWISEERGCSLLRAEIESPSRDGAMPLVTTYANQVKEVDGFWFPSRIEYEMRRGQAIERRELVVVSDARFNIDIPESTFEVKSLRPSTGTVLYSEVGKPVRVYRDGEFQPAQARENAAIEPATWKQPSRLYVFSLATLSLAVVFLVLFILSKRKRGR